MHVTFRPLAAPDELPLFLQLTYDLDGEVAGDLAAGRRRPGWLWIAVAEPGGAVVARAGWWSRPGASEPYLMDFLDFADGHAGTAESLARAALAALLPPGTTPPEFIRLAHRSTSVPAGRVSG